LPEVRRRIGRYQLVRPVGRGGAATVYLARDERLQRDVALKELGAFHASDPLALDRFLIESRLAGSLSHPNVVHVYDFFEHGGLPYISMEYLARGTVRPLVGHLTLPQVIGLLEGLLAGLAYAEGFGIVHRDIKPENLLVTEGGGVKIADFGIAKAYEHATRGLTATGTTVGTPAYMAPEQAMGKPLGPGTDLYATGVVAYEMLVGRVPFWDTDTPVAVLHRQVYDAIPPVREINPELDARLAVWVERLLSKAIEDRPRGAAEAWEELEDIAVSLLGSFWRREARLPGPGTGAPVAKPLTPARFPLEGGEATAGRRAAGARNGIDEAGSLERPRSEEERASETDRPGGPDTYETFRPRSVASAGGAGAPGGTEPPSGREGPASREASREAAAPAEAGTSREAEAPVDAGMSGEAGAPVDAGMPGGHEAPAGAGTSRDAEAPAEAENSRETRAPDGAASAPRPDSEHGAVARGPRSRALDDTPMPATPRDDAPPRARGGEEERDRAGTRPAGAAGAPVEAPRGTSRGGRRLAAVIAAPVAVLALAVVLLSALQRDRGEEARAPSPPTQPSASPTPTTVPQETVPDSPIPPEARVPSPATAERLNSEGYRLIRNGRPAEAVGRFRRSAAVLNVQSGDLYASALFGLGRSLRLSGQPEEALVVLERRAELPPRTRNSQAELAAAREEVGERRSRLRQSGRGVGEPRRSAS
jgi:Protein kinase domain